MVKYHLTPDGNTGPCKAEYSCPFGDLTQDHYASQEEARKAFERHQGAPFAALPSKEKRPHWLTLSEKQAKAVVSNYARAYQKLRAHPYGDRRAADDKQKALKATADRYRIPLGQVKSLVREDREARGVMVQHDPAYMKNLALSAQATLEESKLAQDSFGARICSCGSNEDVKARLDPVLSEIYNEQAIVVSCRPCYLSLASDV